MREWAEEPDDLPQPAISDADRARLSAYVAHFNARDFDAIRGLIADDIRLDLVNRTRLNGKTEVSRYFGNYDKVSDWHLAPGLVEGRPAILVFDPAAPDGRQNTSCCCNGRPARSPPSAISVTRAYVIDGAEISDLNPGLFERSPPSFLIGRPPSKTATILAGQPEL